MKSKLMVNEIPDSGLTVQIDESIDWVEAMMIEVSEVKKKGSISGAIHFSKMGDIIAVKASLSGDTYQECSRCLKEIRVPFSGEITLYYEPDTSWKRRNGEIELKEGDILRSPYNGIYIDMEDIIREHIYLSIPIKPLCSEKCMGLCPICGENRNVISCKCQEEEESRLRKVLINSKSLQKR